MLTRSFSGASVLMVAATVTVGSPYSAAIAQSDAPPFAQPLLGQVPANGALSVVAAGNADRIAIYPNFDTVYDSNVLRRKQPDGADASNVRFTPGVSLALRRSLGRFAFNVSGTAGYDFNNRYKFLNRSRLDFTAGAKAPVGALCNANLAANYDQFQFDLGNVTQTLGSTTRNQDYDLSFGCQRPAGFSPVVGLSYHVASSAGTTLYGNQTGNSSGILNGPLKLFDYTQLGERAGVAYAQPSLGVATLSVTASQLRRPNVVDVIGIDDSTNIRSVTLSLDRAVSKRVQMNVAVGYTQANPSRGGVSSFAGVSYNGRVNWNIVPLFSVTASAERQVTSENGINATYVIREDYIAAVSWQLTRASRVSVNGSRTNRDFRGEGLTVPIFQQDLIRADRTTDVGARYSYDTARWLRLSIGADHQWRSADNSLFNYQSTSVSGSVGTQF